MHSGEKHWYDRAFALNDLALDCGYRALDNNDLRAARIVAHHIAATGFSGPATMRFLATCAAANSEWGTAKDFYAKSKKVGQKLLPNSGRWEYQERLFADVQHLLKATGFGFIDLSPNRPTQSRLQALDFWWRALAETGQLGSEAVAPILASIGDLRKERIDLGARSAAAASVATMTLKGLRNYLAGKSVCLVANSGQLAQASLGATIDGYDTVVRFNSFAIDPPHTGTRTDIHAAVHLYDYNLDVPVDVRILVSGKKELWTDSVYTKIRPGRQAFVGDATLSWPARDLGLIDAKSPFRTPTVGFNILRTILHLGSARKVDLIGFDFYQSGMLRVAGAEKIAHSAAHNSAAEKEWVLSHAKARSGMIITMQ